MEEKKKRAFHSAIRIKREKPDILIRVIGRFMEIKGSFLNLRDRRSKSCLHRSMPRYLEGCRTSSLTDHNQLNQTFDSSTESIQKHLTPKHELYKVKTNAKREIRKLIRFLVTERVISKYETKNYF